MIVADSMSREFVILQPESTIATVLQRFLDLRLDIGCILNAKGDLDGIVTKYNIYRMLLSGAPMNSSILAAIIRDVVTVGMYTPLAKARETLITANVAHAVVLNDQGKVAGIMAKSNLMHGYLLELELLANQLTSLIENQTDAIIAIDNNHRVQTFNTAAERMFQLPRDAILGCPVEIMLPQIGADVTLALQDSTVIEQKKIRLPAAIAMVTYTPIMIRNQVLGAFAVLRDLTDYERVARDLETTKKLERTLETALGIAYDGIVIIDEECSITMVNDALLDLYGFSRGELLGAKVSEKLPELNLEETLKNGKELVGEIHEIHGNRCVITRMPIVQMSRNVGAIAKIIFRNLDRLRDLLGRLEHLESELTYYRGEYFRAMAQGNAMDHVITRNPAMEALKNQTYLAAQGFSTVLITGESGTGKEVFAQAVHEISGRPGKFVKVNCAAIPAELLESEFFGYADGAFTGARRGGKPGKFELADGGTLFLDEIGDMPISLQAKLLRVFQERSFERIGDTNTTQVNVRIVTATNKNLEELIAKGKFREDLYYRINVIGIFIPPLRERKEDLPLLCDHLIQKLNQMLGKQVQGITDSALEVLSTYHWPGNVRELENVLERAMNLESFDWIMPHHLQLYSAAERQVERKHGATGETTRASTLVLTRNDAIETAEKDLILKILRECGGNRSLAAKKLGISRSTLYSKMRKYHIEEKSQFESN